MSLIIPIVFTPGFRRIILRTPNAFIMIVTLRKESGYNGLRG